VNVEVRLFATLGAYLPAGANGDSVALDLAEGATLAEVMRALHIPAEAPCIAVVNGHDAEPHSILAEGDVVSMFPPLAGGAAEGSDPAPIP